MLELYKKHLEARHLSADTIECHLRNIEEFTASFANTDLRDIELSHFIRYRKRLAKRPIVIATQYAKLRSVKAFFTFLHERGKLLTNPAADLPILKVPRRLPRAILDGRQVIALLRQPNTKTCTGIRNRAIMELLYSSGLRAGELCKLTVYDLDDEERSVRIVQGKGRKDRLVPVGPAALDWCARYVEEVRPHHLKNNCNAPSIRDRLFLTVPGNRMQTEYLHRIVKNAAAQPLISPNTWSAPTASAMPARPKCSAAGPVSATSRRCSATPISAPLKCTPTSSRTTCRPSTRRPPRASAARTPRPRPSC